MACSNKCKQFLCYLYVALLFVSGALLIFCSVFLAYKLVYYFKLTPSECIAPFILILLLALGHISLTWLGIKGLRYEYLTYIFFFMAITVVFIICEMAVGIWSMVLRAKLNEKSAELMKNSFEEFVKTNFNYDKLDWVRLQSRFECCGISGVNDYAILGSIPFSCCTTTGTACTTIYQIGCKEYLVAYTQQLLLHIGLIAFGSAIFQILGVVAFYCLLKAIKLEHTVEAAKRRSRTQEIDPLHKLERAKSRSHSMQKSAPTAS